MIAADTLLENLGRSTDDKALQALLRELGLMTAPELEDGFGHAPAKAHGLDLFFKEAHYHAKGLETERLSPGARVFSDVSFSAKGFLGELPHALKFTESRAEVRKRLGEPNWSSPLGVPNDRWELDDRYLTLDFSRDESRIKRVTIGLVWTLTGR